jgi:anti-sigma B factor antagonist
MSFEVRIEGDARVVVSGELDMATSPELTSAIEALANTGEPRVLVDLSDVSFIDSTGISALVLAMAKVEVQGAVLVLGQVSRQVDTALSMVGLESEFVRDVSSS